MKHPTSRLLFDYWDKLRCARDLPNRAEIEPGRIRHLLPHSFILGAGPADAPVIRLAGACCTALFARDLEGLPFRALWAGATRSEADELTGIVRHGDGIVAGLVEFGEGASGLRLELLLLPLRHRGAKVGRMLGALSVSEQPAPQGRAPICGLTTRSLRIIRPDRPPGSPPAAGVPTGGRPRPNLVVLDGGLSP